MTKLELRSKMRSQGWELDRTELRYKFYGIFVRENILLDLLENTTMTLDEILFRIINSCSRGG